MKTYHVDVSGLSADEKDRIYKQIVGYAFLVNCLHDESGVLSCLEVFWDGQEDFLASPLCPAYCSCKEV